MSSRELLIYKDLNIHYRYFGYDLSYYLDEDSASNLIFKSETKQDSKKKKKSKNSDIELELKKIALKNTKTVNKALDNVSITIHENESVGLIGESGSGKSTLLLSIFDFPNENLVTRKGEIFYFDEDLGGYVDLFNMEENKLNRYRGLHFGLIPQLPRESLNPWIKVGLQSGEILQERKNWKEEKIKERVIEILGKSALSDPETKFEKFPNQISTGEVQKVCISLALMANPKLLFGDELFSSLDTISQSQVIKLLLTLKKDIGINFVTANHNIGAAGLISDKIGVIYGGECIEMQEKDKFFEDPLHPYSKLLMESNPWYATKKGNPLAEIPGDLPKASNWPSGCKFHPRCPKAIEKCKTDKPPRMTNGTGFVECFLFTD